MDIGVYSAPGANFLKTLRQADYVGVQMGAEIFLPDALQTSAFESPDSTEMSVT